MSSSHDLDHIRTMIDTFLHHSLQSLERISALEIVVRPDEHRTVLVSGLTDTLRHLLLRLKFHIHISRTCLNSLQEAFFRNLHRTDETALLGAVGKRRICLCHLLDAAGRHKRNIRRKDILYFPGTQFATVKTDLRHLATFQNLEHLLIIPVLYSSTNHIILILSNP